MAYKGSILFILCPITNLQISAKHVTHSRFVAEVNLKSLCPKSSQGSILKSQNRVYKKHEYQPGSKMVEY